MSDENNKNTGGIGFCGLLTILFVGLKLTGYISWSWWWVLSPMWIPACLYILLFGWKLTEYIICLIILWIANKMK